MDESVETVGPLKKVILLLDVRSDAHGTESTGETIHYEFIFGVGSQGLSPLEYSLSGKREGDQLQFHLRIGELAAFFQHLFCPALNLPDSRDSFVLKARILKLSQADQKEVIKAMAEASACADHCCGH